MKRTVFLLAVLLAFPAFTAAQSQTRERRSSDSEPLTTGSTAVRSRVVGSTRSANHVEKSTAVTESKNKSGSSSGAAPVNQISSEPKWGNTPVIVRSAPNERIAPLESSPIDKQTSADQNNTSTKKLVQQTALVSAAASPVAGNASSPKPLATRGPSPTVVYHVGIGDVLDIRLSNLPTRESTLFTVLKNGSLEYPLLSGPLAVAGMTTDEIAKLLTNEIKVIKTARVSVSVRDYASHTVVITGLVDSPGRKIMRLEAMPLFVVLAEALPRPEASLATLVRSGNSQTI
ncbi:MAG TPA: polysaccharide biosynthesis/export family protein, partial [Pyrinomonadaceae bacterium]